MQSNRRWTSLFRSLLHRRREDPDEGLVDSLYLDLLGRFPDPEARANALTALHTGTLSRAGLHTLLLSSPEYEEMARAHFHETLARGQGLPDADFVQRVYPEVLGRPAAAQEYSAAVYALAERALSRPEWLGQLIRISEYPGAWAAVQPYRELLELEGPLPEAAFIEGAYLHLLERRPEAKERETLERELQGEGRSRAWLIYYLLSSAEWMDRAMGRHLGLLDRLATAADDTFVRAVYQEMLCHLPDPVNLERAVQALQQGEMTRRQFLQSVCSSREYHVVRVATSLCRHLLADEPPRREIDKAAWQLQHDGRTLQSVREEIQGSMEHYFYHTPPPPPESPFQVQGLPTDIGLELTTYCNMNPPCIMCCRAPSALQFPQKHMAPEIWQRLLPWLQQAPAISVYGVGEPLLYPQLFDLLSRLDPQRNSIGFNTNGHLLTEEVCRRLIENQVAWMSISLDAATPEMYRRLRRRDDWPRLLDKIRRFVALKHALGSQRPMIEVNMTVMGVNLPEAPAFVRLAAGLGVSQVMFQQIIPGGETVLEAPDGYLFDYPREELDHHRPLHDEMMAQSWQESLSLGIPLKYELVYRGTGAEWPEERQRAPISPTITLDGRSYRPAAHCIEPWYHLLVDVHGEAMICCFHLDRVSLGNVLEEAPEAIWNGPRARTVRQLLLEKPVPLCCRGCYHVSGQAEV